MFLDEIGFAWKADGDKLWHQQYEKIVELSLKERLAIVWCQGLTSKTSL
jgi:hypothetical protein